MKNNITLSVLALCCAGRIAQAQMWEAWGGLHVGTETTLGMNSSNVIRFGDSFYVTIAEVGTDDFVEHRAAQFSFMPPSHGSGNVGIGTKTPVGKLDVRGAGFFQNGVPYRGTIVNLQASQANETGGGIAIGDDGGFFDYNDGFVTYKNLDSVGGLKVDANFTVAGANSILQINNGNGGLTFMSKVPSAWFGMDSPFVLQANSSGDMVMTPVFNSPASGIVIKQNGNVGIGATSPLAKLHVRNATGVGVFSGNLDPFGIAMFESNVSAPTTHAWFAENGTAVFAVRAGGEGYFAGQVKATTLLLTSDRNAKANFRSVDSREVLKKVASLPLSTWHYTNAPGVRHIGPMAQDFKAAFAELGEDDTHIATVDADGVALASIQALYEIVQEKDSAIAALQSQVSALKTELAGVKDNIADRLAALEKAMSKDVVEASFRPEAAR